MGCNVLYAVIGIFVLYSVAAKETGKTTAKFNPQVQTALNAHQTITSNLPLKVDAYIAYMKDTEKFQGQDEVLIAVFNLMDKNKNGHLEQAEFINAYLIWNEFRHYDRDGDWKLTKDELIKIVDADESNHVTFMELYTRVNNGYQLANNWEERVGTNYLNSPDKL